VKLGFDIGGGLFETIDILDGQDLGPPCREWGKAKRDRVKAAIESGEGLPPLAQSTLDKRRRTRTGRFTNRGQLRTSYARRLDNEKKRLDGLVKWYETKYSARGAAAGVGMAKAQTAVLPPDVQLKLDRYKARREKINEALQKFRADAGKIAVSRREYNAMKRANIRAEAGLSGWAGHEHDLSKYVIAKTAEQKYGKTRADKLGDKRFPKLASTIRMKVIAKGNSGTVIVRCAAGVVGLVHNDGGPVGNSASVPATHFLMITGPDIEDFKRILVKHGVVHFQEEK
jgi:hypothetical protein